MKKTNWNKVYKTDCSFIYKSIRIMRASIVFLLIMIMQLHAEESYSQKTVLSLSMNGVSVEQVLDRIEKDTDYRFLFTDRSVEVSRKVSVSVKSCKITDVLDLLFKDTDVAYKIVDRQIILSRVTAVDKERIITGVIKDSKGETIAGANVIQRGTTNGTITDMNGMFSIKVPRNSILVVSYIGYITREVPTGSKQVMDIVLLDDMQALDEVVVVSYGTQKKRNLTGAVAKVNGKELADLPVGQIGQKLQGQVSGIQINQTTGTPGQGISFRIRGAASVNGGNEPLFVVDGMPITTGINNINPDEIESFSVLKDAAATSLYGSRAASGVILITTKRGKSGRTEVTFSANYGIQAVPKSRRPDVMDAHSFARYQKEFYEDKAKYEGYANGVPEPYQNPEQYGKGTDWYDEMIRTAPTQNYTLSITAGKDRFSSAIVASYYNQKGVVDNTNFERFSLRANNDFQVNDKIKIGLNLAPTLQLTDLQNTDGPWCIMSSGLLASPILSPYEEDGSYKMALNAPGMFPQPNWLRVLNERQEKFKGITLLSNAFAEVELYKGLKYKIQANIELQGNNHRQFIPSTAAGAMFVAPPQKATGYYFSKFVYNWNVENMLTYNQRFGQHSIDALIGYSAQKFREEYNELSGTDYPDDSISWLNVAATKNGSNYLEEWALVSLIGRVNYSFKDRYLLQATFRRDGCSRFGSSNKYANFPSISAGWIISDEPFMEKVTPVMNYLKLRASYGLTGNYNVGGNYKYIPSMGDANYIFGDALTPGKALNSLGNNKLTWETTKQFDLGLDFSFLNDRIFVMYDYYYKYTDGMLFRIDIPVGSGFSNVDANIGDYKSWGHEITINTKNMVNEFKWNTNFNISFNKNEIMKLGTNDTPVGGYTANQDYNRLQVGQPIGVFVGYVFDGIYMNEEEFESQPKHVTSEVGSVRMKDVSGPNGVPDGVIDTNDRIIIGDPNPDFIFGMTNEFSYKNFDLSILLTGSVGGDIIDEMRQFTDNLDGVFNVRNEVAERWRSPENPGNGLVPRTKSGTTELYRLTHSGWVTKNSYLSLKNITLGYTIPFKPNAYISKARVFFSGQQLAVWSKYKGMNPEVSAGGANWQFLGVDRVAYPVPRTFSIGCNITF